MDLLNGMLVFTRVADSGTFAAAADALDVSGAQVSRVIAELEAHLQTRLLHRTTRRLRLTESGERFLLRSRQLLEQVEEAKVEARGAHLTPNGQLRVHSTSGVGVLITPLVARYAERYPQVSVELTLSQHNPDPLEEGHDLVISIAQALPDSRMVAQPIGRLFSVPCASPGYLEHHGIPEQPADLLDHRCLHLQDFQEDEWVFDGPQGRVEIKPSGTFSTNVADAMVSACEAGMGISLLPFFAATEGLRCGRLRRVLPDYRLRERSLFTLYPSRRYLDAKVRTWIDFLQESWPALYAEHERVLDARECWATSAHG